jgi:glycosyltransferase involved in cell wall biosynthesis
MINLVFFVSDGIFEYNSSHFRVTLQANALEKSGLANVKIVNVKEWLKQTPLAMNVCSTADVIVIQRVMIAESIEHAVKWESKGKKVVVDWDDAYDLIGEENAAYPFWGRGEVEVTTGSGHKFKRILDEHPVDSFKNGLQHISGGTMPSRQLQKDWSRYASCYYIPNYLDSNRYKKASLIPKTTEKITIGWGGSLSHLTSFSDSGVQDALGQLLSERDDVELLIVGDKRVVEQLPFKKSVRFIPYVMWHQWLSILALYNIGIAPLAGKYDARRSGLKVTEYIAMGIPFVATKSMPYEHLLECKSGRFIDQGGLDTLETPNPEDWYTSLAYIVDNYQEFPPIAKKEKSRYYKVYDAVENAQSILNVYMDILNG